MRTKETAAKNKALTEKQIGQLKDTLLAHKESVLNKKRPTEQFCLDRNELSDHVDEASENAQKSEELRFRNRDNFYLKKIDKALEKITRGEYGFCYECDEPIGFERLRARPVADMCVGCKEESEKDEKGNFYKRQSKSKGVAMHEIQS